MLDYTEFKRIVRKNALANPSLYSGRYTCKLISKRPTWASNNARAWII